MSENPTWKFVFYYAIPKRFSPIKVGLCIFFNVDSFEIKENDLEIHLYGLVFICGIHQQSKYGSRIFSIEIHSMILAAWVLLHSFGIR